ncbi:MAG: hypothetical protein Q8K67_08775 [Geothrix sp.]|nr:hypothetical protein [Geothrix sp.]
MPNPPILPSRSRFLPLRKSLLLSAGLLGLSLGCRSDQVSHYRVPKEAAAAHPDHPGHAEEGMPASGMPSQGMPPGAGPGPDAASSVPPPPTSKGSLKWSLPKGWSELPGGGMRFATFKSSVPGRLEATVVVLPGAAGGELPNVNRWRGQIALPPLDEAGLATARTILKTKAGALNIYDFTSDGQAKSRMVVGYISTPDGNTWFLKLTGDEGPVAKAKPDFMTILGSLRLD